MEGAEPDQIPDDDGGMAAGAPGGSDAVADTAGGRDDGAIQHDGAAPQGAAGEAAAEDGVGVHRQFDRGEDAAGRDARSAPGSAAADAGGGESQSHGRRLTC